MPDERSGVMRAPHVLLIEDEPALVRGLSDSLRDNGFTVSVATDGQRGLDALATSDADIILLDVMLPKVNGYEICEAARRQGIDVPILMLTAKGQEQDIVLGLNVGADDYITKPFRIGELIARMRAFLRRRATPVSTVHFGDCEIDLHGRLVRKQGAVLNLTAKERDLLIWLAARPGRAVSREAILNAVWGSSVFVTQRSVDRCVATLRSKIEPDPHRPVYIHTIRDIGYRFEPSPDGVADGA
jgi:DNA-binding response OmpR family regulator